MNVLITGATGFIGSVVGQKLTDLGHSVVVVTRNNANARQHLTFKAELIEHNLNKAPLTSESYKNIDAIINLAGESVDSRWSVDKKNKIINSRVMSSRNLLANCPDTVKTILTASAQGIYGDRGDEILTEKSEEGRGFLADVCRAWEAEFMNRNQRVIILRIGMVLSKRGGVLKKLIPLFQKNLGAVLGSGLQWMSWISLNDLVNVITESLVNEGYSGVINAVNNNPVTNFEFTETLCQSLNVWRLPRVPATVLRVVLGEMSQLVLASLKVKPQKLNELGFKFHDTKLEDVFNSD